MASITKASQGALSAIKPFIGLGEPCTDNGEQLTLSKSLHSSGSTTLIGSDRSHNAEEPEGSKSRTQFLGRNDGWSRTLRSVASFFYVKPQDRECEESPTPSEKPQTPKRALSRRKSWNWTGSSIGSGRSFKSIRSPNSIGRRKNTPVSPSSRISQQPPTLNVRIPGCSLHGKSGSNLALNNHRLKDPAIFFSFDELEAAVVKVHRAKQGLVAPNRSALAIGDLDDPYIDHPLDSQRTHPENVESPQPMSRQSSALKVEDKGYASDVESNTEDDQLKCHSDLTTFTSPSSGPASKLANKPANRPSSDLKPVTLIPKADQLSPCRSLGKENALSVPNLKDLAQKTTSPARFPLRKRLNMRRSIETIQGKIANTFSGTKAQSGRPVSPTYDAADRPLSPAYDADAEDSEASLPAPSMGPKEPLQQARKERDDKYAQLMLSPVSTRSDDETTGDLKLARMSDKEGLPQSVHLVNNRSPEVVSPHRPSFAGDLRYAVEAIERPTYSDSDTVRSHPTGIDTAREGSFIDDVAPETAASSRIGVPATAESDRDSLSSSYGSSPGTLGPLAGVLTALARLDEGYVPPNEDDKNDEYTGPGHAIYEELNRPGHPDPLLEGLDDDDPREILDFSGEKMACNELLEYSIDTPTLQSVKWRGNTFRFPSLAEVVMKNDGLELDSPPRPDSESNHSELDWTSERAVDFAGMNDTDRVIQPPPVYTPEDRLASEMVSRLSTPDRESEEVWLESMLDEVKRSKLESLLDEESLDPLPEEEPLGYLAEDELEAMPEDRSPGLIQEDIRG